MVVILGTVLQLVAVVGEEFGPDHGPHTAVVDGYIIEGHVHAREIKRLLKERPSALGLAVPGMPIGSPGMEQGDRKQPYSTILFDERGKTSVYARH